MQQAGRREVRGPGRLREKRGRGGASLRARVHACVCARVRFLAYPSSFSTTPPPPLLPPHPHRSSPPSLPRLPAPESGEQQQQQQWSFTASPRLTVREYTSGEQNGYGREPEQPVLRHGQLPPRPLVTASAPAACLFARLSARFEFTLDFS